MTTDRPPGGPATGAPAADQGDGGRDTRAAAALPVDGLPPDAPQLAYAAVDDAPDQDAADVAHDPGAQRGPAAVLAAYADALAAGDAAVAADLFAANGLLTTGDRQVNGRDALRAWHEELLAAGAVTARPRARGNDAGALALDGPGGHRVVELSFDASGRIGTARWLTPTDANRSQEDREDNAL